MNILKQFENETNIIASELTESKLIEVLSNEKYSHFFKNPSEMIALVEGIQEVNSDIDLKKELNTIKYSVLLLENEDIINREFTDYREKKINREKLIEDVQRFLETKDPIFKISIGLCVLIALEDFDLKTRFEEFKASIIEIKNIVNSFGRIENSFRVISDILDLIYTFTEKFFNKYELNLLENINWPDEEIDELNNFRNSRQNNEIPDLDIKPEQLGLLDLTKLKSKGSETNGI